MKEYPLEVHSMMEWGYYSKGHHPKKDFIEAVKNDYEDDISNSNVAHLWVKVRPALPHEKEEFGRCQFFVDSEKGKRGAFPITQSF